MWMEEFFPTLAAVQEDLALLALWRAGARVRRQRERRRAPHRFHRGQAGAAQDAAVDAAARSSIRGRGSD